MAETLRVYIDVASVRRETETSLLAPQTGIGAVHASSSKWLPCSTIFPHRRRRCAGSGSRREAVSHRDQGGDLARRSSVLFRAISSAGSSADAISSRSRMAGLRNSARARASRCVISLDSQRPLTPTAVSKPSNCARMNSSIPASLAASAMASSVAAGRPMRIFSRIVELKTIRPAKSRPFARAVRPGSPDTDRGHRL